MKINNVQIIYSALYVPHSPMQGIPEKFFIAGKVNDKEAAALINLGIFASERSGLFNFKSTSAPKISVRSDNPTRQDYECMARALQIADARNIPGNRLFKNLMVDLDISIYEFEFNEQKRNGAGLVEVFVDPFDLCSAAMEQ